MEKLLHDSFANYVVQTSLDFADEDQRIEVSLCEKRAMNGYSQTNWFHHSLLSVFALCYPLYVQHLTVNVFTARSFETQSPTSAIKHNSHNSVNVIVSTTKTLAI